MHQLMKVVMIRPFRLISVFVLGLLVSSILSAGSEAADAEKSSIAFVGASFTAGAGARGEFYSPVDERLAKMLYEPDSVVIKNFSPVGNRAGMIDVVKSPVKAIKEQIKEADKIHPKFIVSIDGLFWVLYATAKSESERLNRLKDVLAFMAERERHFVVTNFVDTVVNSPLGTFSVSTETVNEANKMLSEWVQNQNGKELGGSTALLLDMTQYFTKKSIDCGSELGYIEKSSLVSSDKLHPNDEGYDCLVGLIFDGLFGSDDSTFSQTAVSFDKTALSKKRTDFDKKEHIEF